MIKEGGTIFPSPSVCDLPLILIVHMQLLLSLIFNDY